MSKLKEMKSAPAKDAGAGGLLYTVLAAVVVIAAIAGFYLLVFASKPPVDMPPLEEGGHSKGNPDAKVRIVEFSDFQCPACGFAYKTLKEVYPQYADSVYFTYRHFPLRNAHKYAQKAAEASECAGEQGRFWEYHDKLFENQENLAVENLKAYAADLGLDSPQFNACLDSSKYASKVNSDFSMGVSLGVDSTPTFFINGEKFSNMPADDFRRAIESRQ